MKHWFWLAGSTLACISGLAAASPPTITLTSPYVQLAPNQPWLFQASVSDGSDVVWQVNNVVGGTAASGTITPQGIYTEPTTIPSPAAVTVTAVLASNPLITRTATITFAHVVGGGHTYFVAPAGSDTAPGTMAAPFRTLTHAANLAQPGDTIYARQGIYNELLAPKHSGNASAGFITFSAYGTEVATIDGTGLPIPNGQAGLITLNGLSYVVVQGFELRNYHTASINDVPIGIFVTGAGSNIQIVNNHVHFITTTAPSTPAQCQSNAFGILAYGTSGTIAQSGLVITGNEVDHLKTGCSETLSLDGNVDGFLVASNLVHDDNNIAIGAIGFEKVSPNPTVDQARHGEIRGNTIYNVTSYGNPDYGKQYASDGIYVDGGTQITIEQNLIHNVDYGIELASEHFGRTTSMTIARNNIVYSSNSSGITIGGYAANKGGTDHCSVVNNTLFANDTKNTGSGEIQIQFNATNNLFANNIAYARPQALLTYAFTKPTSAPTAFDYNDYFVAGTANAPTWVVGGRTFTGLSTYQAATGLDVHSRYADPLFMSIAVPLALSIKPGSPAINAGNDLGAAVVGDVDFAGRPRVQAKKIDIGAFQP